MNARVTAAAKEIGLDYHLESARPGITGALCFVIDESIVIAGAQPVEVFADTLRQAWQES